MSKKNFLVKLSAFTAVLGGIYAFSNYIYKVSSVPHQHTDDKEDFDPAITEGRMFVRNHPDRQDLYVKAADGIQLLGGQFILDGCPDAGADILRCGFDLLFAFCQGSLHFIHYNLQIFRRLPGVITAEELSDGLAEP